MQVKSERTRISKRLDSILLKLTMTCFTFKFRKFDYLNFVSLSYIPWDDYYNFLILSFSVTVLLFI